MNKLKRNIIVVSVLLLVCAAVYLNWSYNNRWGEADSAMVAAEDASMAAAQEVGGDTALAEYFAAARLTRQTSRDEALALLQTAASSENASGETIDSAMNAIAAMAEWSMMETQIENLLLAKSFSDCVVYMSGDGVTVAVPAPAEGLAATDVARITDTITTETEYTAEQIRVIEIRSGLPTQETSSEELQGAVEPVMDESTGEG